MCECLEPRADYYAEIVLHDKGLFEDVEYISRSSLKKMLAEAYKQGYRDADALVCCNKVCNQRIPPIPYECMSEETAKELEDILAKTREECAKGIAVQKEMQDIIRQVNAQELPKDLPNLVPKEEYRNRLKHKDDERL